MNDIVTTTAATTAVTAPIWLPYLTEINELAAVLLTLSTAFWLITQALTKWREDKRKQKEFKQKYETHFKE